MIGDGVGELVMFAVCGTVLLATAVGLLRCLQPGRLLSRMRAFLESAGERMASYSEASADEVGVLVQEKMRQLKVDHVRWCFRVVCMCATPMTAVLMYKLARGLPRNRTVAQDVINLLVHGLTVLVLNCPKVLSWKTLDVLIGVLMLSLAAYTSPWCSSPEFVMNSIASVTAFTCLINSARRSLLVSAIFNSAVAVAITGAITASGEDVFGEAASGNKTAFAAVELLILVIVPVFADMLDASIGGGIRKSLETQVVKEVLSAASALLGSCCDVVVELDAEGTILSRAEELGGFLLRGPGRCFKGFKLPQLFSQEEDRRKFLGKLSAAEPNGQGLAEASHVRMKDGNDELLRVELLWFGFRHLDGTRRFMVGLREFSDFSPKAKRRQRRRQPCAEHAEESGTEFSEASGSGEASESRASGSSMEVQVASLTIDATQEGLPVLGCSPGFRSRIGRLQLGSSLTERLRHGDGLVRWLQLGLNAAHGSGEAPDRQVTLEMRQGRMQAMCRLMMDSEGEPPDLDSVELVFFNIRPCRGRSSGRRGDGSGTSSQSKGTPVAHMSL